MNPLRALVLFVSLAITAGAADLHEIEGGIRFVRLRDLAAAFPAVEQPVIIDLRYAEAPEEAALPALRAILNAPGPLRLVLYDAAPSEALVDLLARRHANVLTIAPEKAHSAPDVRVAVDPAADRAAYDALEAGAPLSALISSTIEKRRYDEAALVAARSGGAKAPAAKANAAAAQEKDVTPAPPIDVLLQQAVYVARGLSALGRP